MRTYTNNKKQAESHLDNKQGLLMNEHPFMKYLLVMEMWEYLLNNRNILIKNQKYVSSKLIPSSSVTIRLFICH